MKDKKMLSMIIISVAVVVVFIIIMVVISTITGGRLSFEKVEDKMTMAAKTYFEINKEELPNEDGDSTIVNAETLAQSKKMKALNRIVPKDSSCSGKVIVTKNGENYLYSAILDCGEDYSSKTLMDVLTEGKKVVTSGDGLYANGNGYLYKGENTNNLVKFGKTIWAIMDIDSDGFIRLINISGGKKDRIVWDDRYNKSEGSSIGKNDYSISKIKNSLISYEQEEYYLEDEYKVYAIPRPWCIGKRSESNLEINNNEECKTMSEAQMFGLPYTSDAYIASTDPDCHNINDASCINYNYLSNYALSSWTMTGVAESSSSAYYIVAATAVSTKASATKNIMPTIYISGNVMYASGEGSMQSPYILK